MVHDLAGGPAIGFVSRDGVEVGDGEALHGGPHLGGGGEVLLDEVRTVHGRSVTGDPVRRQPGRRQRPSTSCQPG